MYFLALSQAPPALAIIKARRTQPSNPPANIPPRAFAPNKKPTNGGIETAITPGNNIL